MKKRFYFLLAFLFVLSSPNTKVLAQTIQNQNANNNIQSILSVSPIIIDTTIKPGQIYTFPIQVKDMLDQPLGIKTSIEDFNPTDEETAIETYPNPSPILSYSSLSEESFIIDPKETKTFNLSIKTPKKIKSGGYYEVVFLTPFYTKVSNPNSPTVLSKIGILILANAGTINYSDQANKVKILDFRLEEGSNFTPLIRVENLYFNHFSAKPFITITPLFGKPQVIELTDKRILPGKIRRWEEQINPDRKSIFYTAKLAISVGQGNFVYRNTFFVLIPVRKTILLVILIAITSLIILRRRQIKKAFRIVISGK